MSDQKKSILIVFVIIIFFYSVDLLTKEEKKTINSCLIKGNISYYGGKKIYHLPGDYYYDATNPEYIFCTEKEAIEAGFRRSKVR